MNTDTIAERLNAKADAELLKKIDDSIAWIWKESGHGVMKPELADFPKVSSAYSNTGAPAPKDIPWIGAVQEQFKHVAFAYLRDSYRRAAESSARHPSLGKIIRDGKGER